MARAHTIGCGPVRTARLDHTPWPILKAYSGFATAVHAHYEAMRLHHRHPSMAHLTYVAAIEGFGTRFVQDTRATATLIVSIAKGRPKGVLQGIQDRAQRPRGHSTAARDNDDDQPTEPDAK
jgi:hypothetical protein